MNQESSYSFIECAINESGIDGQTAEKYLKMFKDNLLSNEMFMKLNDHWIGRMKLPIGHQMCLLDTITSMQKDIEAEQNELVNNPLTTIFEVSPVKPTEPSICFPPFVMEHCDQIKPFPRNYMLQFSEETERQITITDLPELAKKKLLKEIAKEIYLFMKQYFDFCFPSDILQLILFNLVANCPQLASDQYYGTEMLYNKVENLYKNGRKNTKRGKYLQELQDNDAMLSKLGLSIAGRKAGTKGVIKVTSKDLIKHKYAKDHEYMVYVRKEKKRIQREKLSKDQATNTSSSSQDSQDSHDVDDSVDYTVNQNFAAQSSATLIDSCVSSSRLTNTINTANSDTIVVEFNNSVYNTDDIVAQNIDNNMVNENPSTDISVISSQTPIVDLTISVNNTDAMDAKNIGIVNESVINTDITDISIESSNIEITNSVSNTGSDDQQIREEIKSFITTAGSANGDNELTDIRKNTPQNTNAAVNYTSAVLQVRSSLEKVLRADELVQQGRCVSQQLIAGNSIQLSATQQQQLIDSNMQLFLVPNNDGKLNLIKARVVKAVTPTAIKQKKIVDPITQSQSINQIVRSDQSQEQNSRRCSARPRTVDQLIRIKITNENLSEFLNINPIISTVKGFEEFCEKKIHNHNQYKKIMVNFNHKSFFARFINSGSGIFDTLKKVDEKWETISANFDCRGDSIKTIAAICKGEEMLGCYTIFETAKTISFKKLTNYILVDTDRTSILDAIKCNDDITGYVYFNNTRLFDDDLPLIWCIYYLFVGHFALNIDYESDIMRALEYSFFMIVNADPTPNVHSKFISVINKGSNNNAIANPTKPARKKQKTNNK